MLIPEKTTSSSPNRDQSDGELVLAVDSGGTKTSCVLARISANRECTILGTGRSTAGNPRVIGLETSAQAIAESVKLAKAEAGLDSFPCHRALFAVAGTLNEPIRTELCRILSDMELAEECFVVPDLIPLVVGSDSTVSIGLIAGTGSVAIGRDRQGSFAVAGGWGPLLGDDGSGFAIGRAALRATLLSLESGIRAGGLVDQVCQALGADSCREMKTRIADATDLRDLVASLAPIVLSDENATDPLCVAIISKAAADLVEMIKSLRARLHIPTDGIKIAFSGGVLQEQTPLIDQLIRELASNGFKAKLERIEDPTIPILNMLLETDLPMQFEILP